MNEFEAAMGTCNLRHIDDEIGLRKIAADRYTELLMGHKGIKLLAPQQGVVYNYSYYPVVFDGYKENREELLIKLADENIFSRRYFYPATNNAECYNGKYSEHKTPIAEFYSNNVLTLALYPDRRAASRRCPQWV